MHFKQPASTLQQENPGQEAVQPSMTCKSIDWYSEGETRVVRIGDVEVLIRLVARKGRRGRILVEAPAGAVFETVTNR